MKKKYEKPQIIIENFSLSTAIAGSCEVKSDMQNAGQCAFDFSGLKVFLDSMGSVCTDVKVKDMGGDGDFNGMCYHVPNDENNLFNS